GRAAAAHVRVCLAYDHRAARSRLCIYLQLRRPPWPPTFPYTTLFRSAVIATRDGLSAVNAGDLLILLTAVSYALFIVYLGEEERDRKSTRLNSSHVKTSYAVICLKKKKITDYLRLRGGPIRPMQLPPA